MADPRAWYDDVVLPALIRGARKAYGTEIRTALAEVGCDDMPRNGSYIVGWIARNGPTPLSTLIGDLGVSKQAAGQLVDTLVLRGYVDRTTDADDRRRVIVTLTERGQLAASAGAAAVADVDADLAARIDAESITRTRATLAALIELERSR
jgi:DNA-binding MarR family transcriptional regulator